MPTKEQKAKKAKLPSLERRYQFRMKRLSTDEGLALEALGGNKEMIKKLADVGAWIMHDHGAQGRGNSGYAFWLAQILGDIARGVEPNEAFGWTNKGHRWRIHGGEELEDLKKRFEVGRTVELFILNVIGKSFEQAVWHAVEVWRIPESECRAAMNQTCMGLKKPKLGAGDAKALALDMVEAFGASGHRGISRDSADAYYRELVNTRGNEEKSMPVQGE